MVLEFIRFEEDTENPLRGSVKTFVCFVEEIDKQFYRILKWVLHVDKNLSLARYV